MDFIKITDIRYDSRQEKILMKTEKKMNNKYACIIIFSKIKKNVKAFIRKFSFREY